MGLPASGTATEISVEKRDLIARMLILTDGFNLGLNSAGEMLSQLQGLFEKMAPGKGDEIVQIIKDETFGAFREMQFEIEDEIIEIYARHFTVEELRAMLDFYATPIGAKTLQLLPTIMQDAQKLGVRYGERAKKIAGPRIKERIQKLVPAKGRG